MPTFEIAIVDGLTRRTVLTVEAPGTLAAIHRAREILNPAPGVVLSAKYIEVVKWSLWSSVWRWVKALWSN